jgi:hypothetical protein
MSPPSSGLKNKPACCLLHAGFLLDLLFCPEDGGYIFLQNIGFAFNWLHSIMSQKIEELFSFVTHLCDDGCMYQLHCMVLSCFCNDRVSYYSQPGLVFWAIARCKLIGLYVGLMWCSSAIGRLRFLLTGRFTGRWYVVITKEAQCFTINIKYI